MTNQTNQWEKEGIIRILNYVRACVKPNKEVMKGFADQILSINRQLLKQERQKWDKDHKILINTIIETKNREIQKDRDKVGQGMYKKGREHATRELLESLKMEEKKKNSQKVGTYWKHYGYNQAVAEMNNKLEKTKELESYNN